MTSLNLGRILGIQVRLHITWFFIVLLLAWSLATEFFPASYPGYTDASYWILGVIAAVLLFASVLAHELSHSLVAKFHGLKVEGITLFFFGGVASASEENMTPKKEFQIAIAGPLFSIALGGVCFLLTLLPLPVSIFPVIDYLFKINIIVALFNMVPGFPLDGGRVLRSILWKATGSERKATKWASFGGQLFGVMMILFGFYNMFSGTAGLWYVLLGSFLYMLAKSSYEQVAMKDGLAKIKVKDIMQKTTKLDASESLESFVVRLNSPSLFIVKHKSDFYVLDFNLFKKIPRHEWPIRLVNDIMIKVKPLRDIDDGYKALLKMHEQNANMLPVVKSGRILGAVTLGSLIPSRS